MISIIIPVINEAEIIEYLLQYLLQNSSFKNISEILVVDGGSTDGTKEIVLKYVTNISSDSEQSNPLKKDPELNSGFSNRPNIVLLNSQKGRAKQMNLGAKHANGDILYFLHADSFPPKNFDEYIINEVESVNYAGCFRMQFDSTHWWLCLASWLTKFNWRACRGGDQSLFVTKYLFNSIGGYNEAFIIYEDMILINELYKRNHFVVINKKIITSARLYKKLGVWRLQYHFWAIYVKRWFGASAKDLYEYYKKQIN